VHDITTDVMIFLFLVYSICIESVPSISFPCISFIGQPNPHYMSGTKRHENRLKIVADVQYESYVNMSEVNLEDGWNLDQRVTQRVRVHGLRKPGMRGASG